MTLAPKPDAAAVRAYRDEHECSLQEAMATTKREWRREQLKSLRRRAEREVAFGNEMASYKPCRSSNYELLQESDA